MATPVEMTREDFVIWAVQIFKVDEDDVSFWDMARDLSGKTRMPEGFEVGNKGAIPAELYDVLQARKAARPAPVRKPFASTSDRSEWEARGSKDGE